MENTGEPITVTERHDGESQTFVHDRSKFLMSFGKISWPAIFAGVFVTAVAQLLLSLLGMGIGLSTVEPFRTMDTMRSINTTAVIWWCVTMLISLFLGGFTTGRMYQTRSKMYLGWHGFLAWCTFTVFSFIVLTTSLGAAIFGTGNIFSHLITANRWNVANRPLDISGITGNAEGLLLQYNGRGNRANEPVENPEALNNNRVNPNTPRNNGNTGANMNMGNESTVAQQSVSNVFIMDVVKNFFSGNNFQNPQLRQDLINGLSVQTGMTRAEASAQVDKWLRNYNDLRTQAEAKATQVARIISITSIIGFFALIIGAFVTIWGARAGHRKEFVVETVRTERPVPTSTNRPV